MAEYINKEELLKKIFPYNIVDKSQYSINAKAVEKAIMEFPASTEFVSVVRCKNCEYGRDLGMAGIWCEHPDNRNPLGCRPNDFCNDGKRRQK